MEWNKTHKIISEDCKLRIDTIGRGVYKPEVYESMGRETVLTEMLSAERSGICYIAPSGSGKTSLFCTLAEKWLEENIVFITGLYFPLTEESALFDYIYKYFNENYGIDLDKGIDETIAFLSENNKKCIIMIDGVDECVSISKMRDALHYTIVRLARGPLKLVINCRTAIWNTIVNHTWLMTLQVVAWQPDDEKALFRDPLFNVTLNSYFSKYQISGTVNEKIREMCRYPVFLRLFCESFRGKQMSEDVSVRYIDVYIRYISNIYVAIGTVFPLLNQKTIVTVVENIVLCFWMHGSYCVTKDSVAEAINETPDVDSNKIFQALIHLHLLKEHISLGGHYILFGHQLILEYLIANVLSKQKLFIDQNHDVIMNDIVSMTKDYAENQMLLPVMEFLLPILEIMGKHHAMISVLMKKEVEKRYKIMLCRAITKMGQVDIESWQVLRELENNSDSEIKAEVASTECLLNENIPGDQVFHSLMLIQSKDDGLIQRTIASRVRFDSNFAMFIKQIQPYCSIIDVQNDLIDFVRRVREYQSVTYRSVLLNLADLITSYNSNAGLENLLLFAEYAKDDTAYLDAWSNVVCNHADKLFVKILKMYVSIVKNDRLKWDRIFRFCLTGGHRDLAVSFKLLAQGFDSLSNYNLMLSTLAFVGSYCESDSESSNSILSNAWKKAKFLPASKQMELREKVTEIALMCFKKNNRSFARIIQELASGEDLKIKERITAELQQMRKPAS